MRRAPTRISGSPFELPRFQGLATYGMIVLRIKRKVKPQGK